LIILIVHYGYLDGEGEYFITVDDSKCSICDKKWCIDACPKSALIEALNDYGEVVMMVKEEFRKNLKYVCSQCKPKVSRPPLPCVTACPYDAIKHSW
jgi:Fe-S-cluster-containing hydrogenase component 2